jgi:hypothetical protein
MTDDVEQIHAKLIAYIDGELTGAQREEIERHLDANPSHRTLIADLMQQRRLLRDLPREQAPVDLIESLQSQLERAALLKEDEDAARPILRIGLWRRALAAAAVFAMAAGLAFLVYSLLPSDKPGVVMAPTSETAAPGYADAAQKESELPAVTAARPAVRDSAAPMPANGAVVAKGSPVDELDASVMAKAPVAAQIPAAPAPPLPLQQPMVLAYNIDHDNSTITITTDNVNLTREQVIQVLAENHVPFSEEQQAAQAAMNRRLLANAAQRSDQVQSMRAGGSGSGLSGGGYGGVGGTRAMGGFGGRGAFGGAAPAQPKPDGDNRAELGEAGPDQSNLPKDVGAPPAGAAGRPASPTVKPRGAQEPEDIRGTDITRQSPVVAQAVAATTQPAQALAEEIRREKAALEQLRRPAAPPGRSASPPEIFSGQSQQAAEAEKVILARMDVRQLNELTAALSRLENAQKQAQRTDRSSSEGSGRNVEREDSGETAFALRMLEPIARANLLPRKAPERNDREPSGVQAPAVRTAPVMRPDALPLAFNQPSTRAAELEKRETLGIAGDDKRYGDAAGQRLRMATERQQGQLGAKDDRDIAAAGHDERASRDNKSLPSTHPAASDAWIIVVQSRAVSDAARSAQMNDAQAAPAGNPANAAPQQGK